MSCEPWSLPLELPDLRADAATILLELLLPRSPGADPAAEPRQLLPSPASRPSRNDSWASSTWNSLTGGARRAKMSRMTSRRSRVFTSSSSSRSACCFGLSRFWKTTRFAPSLSTSSFRRTRVPFPTIVAGFSESTLCTWDAATSAPAARTRSFSSFITSATCRTAAGPRARFRWA